MLSIIVITFNNYRELIDTVSSVNKLDGVDFEVIVINGGRCAKTKQFLKTHSPDYRFQYISEPDHGISDAFNKGIKIARGDYVFFLNSGDLLNNPVFIKEALELLDDDVELMSVYGDVYFLDEYIGQRVMRASHCNLGRGMPYCHQAVIYRKSLFTKHGYYRIDYKYAMDHEWLRRISKFNYKAQHINKFVSIVDGTGVSAQNGWNVFKEYNRSLLRYHLLSPTIIWGIFSRYLIRGTRQLLIRLKLKKIVKIYKKIRSH